MRRLLPALLAAFLLVAPACGGGEQDKAVVTVILTLPPPGVTGTPSFSEELLRAFREEKAGEILAVRKEDRVMEVSVRIRELSDINRIKKAIIKTEPGTEYRIEHK